MFKTLILYTLLISAPSPAHVIAHRGASGHAPENTMVSIRKAIELKSLYIEIDVQQTFDNQIIVIHDNTINRTTNGKGKIKNLSYDYIKQLDAGSWFSEKFKNEKIPTLKQVLDYLYLSPFETTLIIEIKNPNNTYPQIEKRVIDMIHSTNMQSRVILKSFDVEVLKRVKILNPEIKLIYVTLGPIFFNKFTIDNGLRFHSIFEIDFVDYYQIHRYFVSPQIIHQIHQNNKKVIVWDVHKKKHIIKMKEMKVDLIETDYPERVLAEY